MLLAEAQSLWPSAAENRVCFEAHDPLADRQALRELAVWCQQFSPSAAVDEAASPDCLLLDATGCDWFFGSETAFAEKVVTRLQQRGYWAAAVIADTVGAAWGLAHYGPLPESRAVVVAPRDHAGAMRSLPVEALRLPVPAVQVLHELNIFRVDQLLDLPRAQLPSRFGDEMLLCIDRAVGAIPKMLTFEPLEELFEATWQFEPAAGDAALLLTAFEELAAKLMKRMAAHLGVQKLLCSLKLATRETVHFPVELLRSTKALRDLVDLARLQLERLRIPAEIEMLTVRAAAVAPLEFQQEELFGGSEDMNRQKEIAGLLERLSSRLGERAVLRPRLCADAQPEMAQEYEMWMGDAARAPLRKSCASRLNVERPPSLKHHPPTIGVAALFPGGSPRGFRWDGREYGVAHSWGPERVETGWWRGRDVRRDYYIVETAAGERFWIYRNLADGTWFLHGVFA